MKNINIIMVAILTFGLFSLSACSNSNSNEMAEEVVVNKDVEANAESTFSVDGMVCAMGCAAVIQKELGVVNGVAFAKVDFDKELATIKYDDRIVSEADLIAAIENVGEDLYKATKVESQSNLDPEVEEISDVIDVVETVVKH